MRGQRDSSQVDTKNAIEALGRKVTIIIADLAECSAVGSIVSQITSSQDFEILVNVAGIQRRIAAEDFPQDVYNEVMQINLRAPFMLYRDTGKYQIEKDIKGRIINTTSLTTFQGGINMAAYSASKGAVGQLTKALSNELAGKGINVNAIAPG